MNHAYNDGLNSTKNINETVHFASLNVNNTKII